jgi:predicted metal-dependent peptidase
LNTLRVGTRKIPMSKLVERSIMQLLSSNYLEGKEGMMFYGHLLNSMKKVYSHLQVETAAVSVTDKINLYINLEFFKTLTDEQRRDVLAHECMHLIHYHIGRGKDLDLGDMKLFNIACDAAINASLTSLHELGVTVDKLKTLIPDLEYNQTAEYYFNKLKKYQNEKGEEGEQSLDEVGSIVDQHDLWKDEESLGENPTNGDIKKQLIKKAIKESIEKTERSHGKVPMYVRKAYEQLNGATVNWKQQLKQFFARVDKFSKRSTRKKLNRRYKHLNPGKIKTPLTHIAIGVDNSGSIGEDLFMQFLSEIDVASKLEGIRFTIIQADCQVNSVIEYTPGMKLERTGMGGTAYMPAIEEANRLKVDGMIYFGDGDIFGETLICPKYPFLWAMEDGRKPPAEWGRTCYIRHQGEK